jgi:hypothetical protein
VTAREKYDAMIRYDLGPWLRERAFKKRRNRFRRSREAGWEVVDFQASQWGSQDDVRFTMNLWVGVSELAQADADWHVQERVGSLIGDGEDHWWPVDARTDTQDLADEVRHLLEEQALPWLEARSSLDRLLEMARESPDEFPRHALGRFGMLLAKSDFDALATEMAAIAADR